jgi:hypothetical protein
MLVECDPLAGHLFIYLPALRAEAKMFTDPLGRRFVKRAVDVLAELRMHRIASDIGEVGARGGVLAALRNQDPAAH